MTPEEELDQRIEHRKRTIERARRVRRHIRLLLRESERNSAARRERLRRAGLLP
jgi:hypothetical protein